MGESQFRLDAGSADFAETSGIDEAGRGCLAGPVVVAAVTWSSLSASDQAWFPGLADSKTLTPEERAQLYPHILAHARRVRVAVIHNTLIDYLNILKATLHGFELVAPAFDPERPLFIDGNQAPPSLKWARTVVKGDRDLSVVAAAGIVAKVTRDGLMAALDQRHPGYGLAGHKGYATRTHREAIARLGATPFHRKSFQPVLGHLPAQSQADALLEAVTTDPVEDLSRHWQTLQRTYPSFSLQGARRIIAALHQRGLHLLPSIHD